MNFHIYKKRGWCRKWWNNSRLFNCKARNKFNWNIWFEGCVAYKKGVVVNIKEDEFDLIEKEKTVICPKCNNIVLGKNAAFYSCYYNIYGTKINENGQVENFGKKISNFQNIEIPFNNIININGESYEINKTSDNKYTYYFSDDKIKYLKLIFQIKKF